MTWLPDLAVPPFPAAPVATFVPAPTDGVLPDRFFSTSNLPTYVRLETGWQAPSRPRMDCVIVRRGEGLETLEMRLVRRGDLVLTALDEHGKEGVVVHTEGFLGGSHGANEFQFMGTEVSRGSRSTTRISRGDSRMKRNVAATSSGSPVRRSCILAHAMISNG